MAKGDVILKFDAQTATFIQNVLKSRQELLAMASDARKMGDDVANAGDKASRAMSKTDSAAEALAGKFKSVAGAAALAAAAIATATGAADNFNARQEAKAAEALRKTQTVDSVLAAQGRSSDAPGVRLSLDKYANPTEAVNAFVAIGSELGNKISIDDQKKAVETYEAGRVAHLDDAKAIELGKNFGHLARERRPGGGFEGYSDEQLQDMAYKVTVNAPGGLTDRDLRFFARAKDKEQALGVLFAAKQSDENARGLTSIQTAADQDFPPEELRRLRREQRENPEAKRMLRLSEIPKDDRLAAMLQDPSLAPQSERLALKNLAEGAKRVPHVDSLRDVMHAEVDHATYLADQNRQAAAQEAQNLARGATKAETRELTKRLVRAKIEREHPIFSLVPGLSAAVAALSAGVDSPNNQPVQGRSDEQFRNPTRPGSSKEPVFFLEGILRGIEKHTNILDEQTSMFRTSRYTTLSENQNYTRHRE